VTQYAIWCGKIARGFTLAEQLLPLSAFIMHDVDLLPSDEMQKVYERPPPQGCAVHLASVWPMLDGNFCKLQCAYGSMVWPRLPLKALYCDSPKET